MRYSSWQIRSGVLAIFYFLFSPALGLSTVLFEEPFENTSFSSRGWYDGTGGVIDTAERAPGSSTGSLRCTFNQGTAGCAGGNPGRHLFTATDTLYVSYWVKYSANYVGSGRSYHPHEFYILTNADGAFTGPAFNKLTVYIQQVFGTNGGVPQLEIQDGAMIDQTKINQNLIGVTENRAVAGCNGIGNTGGVTVQGVFGGSDCYIGNGTTRWNAYMWNAPQAYFTHAQGPFYKNNWHHIEAYFKLNTISAGIGQKNGIVQYWIDGTLVINRNDVIMRTGANPNMKFNQFLVGPYIGDGSPVTQSFWIDNLKLATAPPESAPPAPPQNLRVE